MHSDAEYHSLNPTHPPHQQHGNTNDESDLWDQLNDQQSREVQQHQSRFHADPYSRNHPGMILRSMAQSTAERIGATASSAWTAAQHAWRQYPRRHTSSRNTELDLDEQFGINDMRPTSFEVRDGDEGDGHGQQQHSNTNNEPQPNPGYPFVVLQNFPRQAISSARDHWGIVANMDVFLTHLYHYYYQRGLLPMVCKFLVEFISLLFTLWLSRILMKNVDWQRLAACHDETTCLSNWSDYYRVDPLTWSHWALVQGYTLLFLAYATFAVWNFWQSLKHAWTCQYIMHEKLGISKRKLRGGAVAWDTVVNKLLEVQDSGEYRMALRSLDPLRIAQRILRKENFLTAFCNQNLLDTKIGGRDYWCPSLEWCLYTCVLNFMFNHKYEIRPAFYLDAASLERRLQVCGVVHALLLPFLIMFVLLHFLFQNAYDLKNTRKYMGGKQWSALAQLNFREFNELPHMLEQRLEPSYEAAENYTKLFGQSEWIAAVGKLLVFLGGAMGGLMLVLGVINDAILLHTQLWGRNLLWYAGIAGIVYSVGKALVGSTDAQPSVTRNLFGDMDTALKNVSTYTHYYPEMWKGRGWDSNVYKAFGKFIDSKVKLFVWELVALIAAPYILIFKLSKCAPAICEFCLAVKARVPGAGDVCGYSTFDFDTFKDEAWDGRTLGKSVMPKSHTGESLAESIMRTGNVDDATRQHPKPKAREGKMEKSFFSFQAAHPGWKCSPSGQSLVDRVEEYRLAELAAITRERGLYIDAATRQLETLAKLEQQQSPHPARRFEEERLRDSHIPRVPPADAGAGTTLSPGLRSSSPPPMPALQSFKPRTSTPPTAGLPLAGGYAVSETRLPTPLYGAPPPQIPTNFAQDPPSALSSSMNHSAQSPGALRAGLSMELRRLLTMSTLDASESVLQEASPLNPPSANDRTAIRQYYWLERFHEHVESQRQEQGASGQQRSEPEISRSMPTHHQPPQSADGTSASNMV